MKQLAIIALAITACSRPAPKADSSILPSGSSDATRDSLTGAGGVSRASDSGRATLPDVIAGTVDEHGFDPATFIAITPAGGAQTRVSGSQLSTLGAVKGAEVSAWGKRDGSGFRVDSFLVRRANNQDVADGIVSVSGTTVSVQTSNGTLKYADAPTALRQAAGARVWITPPVAGQAPSFGVIRSRQ